MTTEALRRELARSEYASLVEKIDWAAVPQRSLLRIFGFALLVVILVVLTVIAVVGAAVVGVHWPPLGIVIAPITTFVIGSNLTTLVVRSARRELSKFPETSLFSSKAPVLYLREFRTENPDFDQDTLTSGARGLMAIWMLLSPVAALLLSFGRSDRSFENLLHKVLHRVGPLICLSDPHRRRNVGEARRLPINSVKWQEAVQALLERSSLVVMSYSPGASLDWEAKHVIQDTKKPVLVWIPHQLADAGSKSSEELFNAMPGWLTGPFREGGIRAYPDRDYLVLFTAERRVRFRTVDATWRDLKEATRELLQEGDVASSPGQDRRVHVTGPIALARGCLRVAPLVGVLLCAIPPLLYVAWDIDRQGQTARQSQLEMGAAAPN